MGWLTLLPWGLVHGAGCAALTFGPCVPSLCPSCGGWSCPPHRPQEYPLSSSDYRHRWTIPAAQLTSKKAFICFWTLFTNLHWMTKLRERTEQCLNTFVITVLTAFFTASIEAHQTKERNPYVGKGNRGSRAVACTVYSLILLRVTRAHVKNLKFHSRVQRNSWFLFLQIKA